MKRYKSIEERILANLKETTNGCLEWQRSRTRSGYGRMSVWSKILQKVRKRIVTRALWEATKGPIPKGMFVCHKCDNPPCCNIEYLFLGTIDDNAKDWVNKGLSWKGSKNKASKLNEAQVQEIKCLYATGKFSQQRIAHKYGVSQVAISLITRGAKWKHVKA